MPAVFGGDEVAGGGAEEVAGVVIIRSAHRPPPGRDVARFAQELFLVCPHVPTLCLSVVRGKCQSC